MAKNGGSDRARDEAHGIDREGLQRSDPGVGMRKEQFCENEAGDRAVEEKIVPFDRGPDGGRDHRTAKLNLMLGWGEFSWGEGSDVDAECCHGHFLRNTPKAITGLWQQRERCGDSSSRCGQSWVDFRRKAAGAPAHPGGGGGGGGRPT